MEAVDKPSWCRRTIVSSISAFSIPTHSGFVFRNGRVDPLFPLRCAWIRAMGFLGRGCAYRGIVFKIEPVTLEMALRFPDHKDAVVRVERPEGGEANHFHARPGQRTVHRLEDLGARPADVRRSRPHTQGN